MRYINNKFFIEGKNVESLTKKFNTPLYCYSYKNLRENVENFKKAFEEIKPLICFSVKSNSNISLLKEIKKLGLGADVVSKGELYASLKALSDAYNSPFETTSAPRPSFFISFNSEIFELDFTEKQIKGLISSKAFLKFSTFSLKFL